MARISLILPVAPGGLPTEERVLPFRRVLEESGHEIEEIVATDSRGATDFGWSDGEVKAQVADRPGLAAATVAGLCAARGEILGVLDLERG